MDGIVAYECSLDLDLSLRVLDRKALRIIQRHECASPLLHSSNYHSQLQQLREGAGVLGPELRQCKLDTIML